MLLDMLLRTAEFNYAPVAALASPEHSLWAGYSLTLVLVGVEYKSAPARSFCPSLLESELERIEHHQRL